MIGGICMFKKPNLLVKYDRQYLGIAERKIPSGLEYYYQVYSISEGRYKLTNSDILLDSNEKPVLKQLQEKFSPSF